MLAKLMARLVISKQQPSPCKGPRQSLSSCCTEHALQLLLLPMVLLRAPCIILMQGVLQFPPPPKKDEEEEEKPGDKFEGTLQHGLREGRGKYTWSNGSFYDGEYRSGARHGQGRMVFPDKGEYEGQCCGRLAAAQVPLPAAERPVVVSSL